MCLRSHVISQHFITEPEFQPPPPLAKSQERNVWRHWAIMLSGDVTTQNPGSGSDRLPCFYLPDANNLNNFIAKLRAFTEGGRRKSRASATRVNVVSGVCSTFGVQNLNLQQEKAVIGFLSGSDVFVNLPTGHGEPWIYHMAPLVSGDWTSKAAKPFSKWKHSRMQNLPGEKSEILQEFTGKKFSFYFRYVRLAH